jgi:hypothetical protein
LVEAGARYVKAPGVVVDPRTPASSALQFALCALPDLDPHRSGTELVDRREEVFGPARLLVENALLDDGFEPRALSGVRVAALTGTR